jgi:pyroglutamyl-peptidase
MLHVLITGFEPFGGASENPSAQAAVAVAADPPEGVRVTAVILPVTYRDAGPALRAALLHLRPDAVIATGLANGRAELSVERVAINVDDARIADNAGEQRVDQPVVQGGPAAYFSTLPIKAVTAAIRAAGTPAQVSQTAGTFLCNHIFYLASHIAATELPGLRTGFIHLPWLPRQVADLPGQPSLPLASVVAGLRAAIVAAVATAEDIPVAGGAVC